MLECHIVLLGWGGNGSSEASAGRLNGGRPGASGVNDGGVERNGQFRSLAENGSEHFDQHGIHDSLAGPLAVDDFLGGQGDEQLLPGTSLCTKMVSAWGPETKKELGDQEYEPDLSTTRILRAWSPRGVAANDHA